MEGVILTGGSGCRRTAAEITELVVVTGGIRAGKEAALEVEVLRDGPPLEDEVRLDSQDEVAGSKT